MKIKYLSIVLVILMITSVQGAVHLIPAIRSSPSDLTYEVGSTGNILSWTAEAQESGDSPSVYIVRVNGSILDGHNEVPWEDNVAIDVNVDGYSIGAYEVEIEIRDSGYPDNADAAFDTAIVTVVEVGSLPDESSTPVSSTPVSSTPNMVVDTDPNDLQLSVSWLVILLTFIPVIVIRKRIG